MNRGIYITANDNVIDHAIALLNSIRFYDSETSIVLIPYDDNYLQVAEILNQRFGVQVYKDLEFIERLSIKLQSIFGSNFFARPNQFRKQACWFGDFDEFLYIDTDIVVFEKIIDTLNYFSDYDFLCCDYQHLGGIKNVFTPKVLENKVFTETELKDIFNGGFWASKKGLISEQDLYDIFAECAAQPDLFDFSQKTSDQPIINYMILKKLDRRLNLVRRLGGAPGNWAGSPHFVFENDLWIDPTVNQPLQYLHWAGIRIQPGCPYWQVWEHFRYLNESKPEPALATISPTIWQQFVESIRRMR
jgi:hypothetical protein